jgi:GNAT superfamily N-acetyltransferase
LPARTEFLLAFEYSSAIVNPSDEDCPALERATGLFDFNRAMKAPVVKPSGVFLSGVFPEEGSPPPSSTPDIYYALNRSASPPGVPPQIVESGEPRTLLSAAFLFYIVKIFFESMNHAIIINQRSITICQTEAAKLIDLRQRVLRVGLPRDEALFQGDDLPTSRHFGAFDESRAVCCATFHRVDYENEPAWRLRGMATDEPFRGKGVGREVLYFAEDVLRKEKPIRLLWCNARLVAVPFYQGLGWRIVSDLFDIPTAGPHHRMIKRLSDE